MNNELIKKARTFTAQHELADFYSAVAFSGYSHAIDKWNETLADFAGSLLPKWTYCEDALPEDENDYVATVFDQYHQSFFVHWSMFRDGVWDIEGEDLNWKVIAWQPLPAPAEPKEAK